jgi:ribosomal protein L40E
MKPADRHKICNNCDGRIPLEATKCPYCAVDLNRAQKTDDSHHRAIQASLTSLYQPPYNTKKTTESTSSVRARNERPVTPAHHGGTPSTLESTQKSEEEIKQSRNTFFAITSLSLGSILFILGVLQAFFSDKGVLRLEWNTEYWPIYTLVALPMLYFGYRRSGN